MESRDQVAWLGLTSRATISGDKRRRGSTIGTRSNCCLHRSLVNGATALNTNSRHRCIDGPETYLRHMLAHRTYDGRHELAVACPLIAHSAPSFLCPDRRSLRSTQVRCPARSRSPLDLSAPMCGGRESTVRLGEPRLIGDLEWEKANVVGVCRLLLNQRWPRDAIPANRRQRPDTPLAATTLEGAHNKPIVRLASRCSRRGTVTGRIQLDVVSGAIVRRRERPPWTVGDQP